MIKKILVREYLKGYGDMTGEERRAFDGRVGEWLAKNGGRLLTMTDRPMAKSQNLVTITTRWAAEDCRALSEGILLMSALVNVADTWLPQQIYMRSAYRAVRKLCEVLSLVQGSRFKVQGSSTSEAVEPSAKFFDERSGRAERQVSGSAARRDFLRPVGSKRPEVERQSRRSEYKDLQSEKTKGGNGGKRIANADTRSGRITNPPEQGKGGKQVANPPEQTAAPAGKPQGANLKPGTLRSALPLRSSKNLKPGVPVRPRHIDQYVHLLPKATQERAATVKGLLTELDAARENARKLMEAGEHSDKIELWAKKATRLDNAVKAIYRELDAEWAKVVEQGRVVVDDLGNAHVVSSFKCQVSSDVEPGTLNLEPDGNAVELTSEQKQRRRALRKLLTDTRRGNGKTREEHIGKWHNWWTEYISLEPIDAALKDERIIAATKHYGIKLSEELKD